MRGTKSTQKQLLDIALLQAREHTAKQQQMKDQSGLKDRLQDSRLAFHKADVALRDIIATRMESEKGSGKASSLKQGAVVIKTCLKRVQQNHAEDLATVIKVSREVVAVAGSSKKGKSK